MRKESGVHRIVKVCKEGARVCSEYVFAKLCQEYNRFFLMFLFFLLLLLF